MPTKSSGVSMVEILVVVALLGLAAAVAVPDLFRQRAGAEMRYLATRVRADVLRCRFEALVRSRNVGLVFAEEGGRWFYSVVMDGNGNGVSRRDHARGVDEELHGRVWLSSFASDLGMGVPVGWQVPDPGGRGLLSEDRGLRAGRARIVSFSPQGHGTPSTLYFHDDVERMVAVRIYGGTGRVRALHWRRGWPRWRPMPL